MVSAAPEGGAPPSARGPEEDEGLQVTLGQASTAGLKPVNQDFHGACLAQGSARLLKGIVVAVADGISSSRVSQIAAQTAVASLVDDYYATPDSWAVKTAATAVINATNSWLYGQSRRAGGEDGGLICTLSAVVLKGRHAHIFHIGDSRVSRLSGGTLEPLTEDHVTVISAEERYLGRALGAQARVEIDYRRVSLAPGDVLVLNTDGLHDHVDGRCVHDLLQRDDLQAAAEALVDEALRRGSDDNVTVQLLRVDALPSDADAPHLAHDIQLPLPSSPRPGSRIDGFELVRLLSATDRSALYLARSPAGERVALKIPAVSQQDDAAFLQRFALEEWVARRVRSPHVLQAVETPYPRTSLYAVTRYIEGCTLRQWLTDHPAPDLATVRDIITQLVRGLRALHRQEILHQDLRPENIMIDGEGTVTIIDLGSAAVAGVEEAAPGVLGELPGTLQYTAPEYLSGDAVSWRSDQFALGVIAYEMLTGALPYGAQVARVRGRRDQQRLRYRPAAQGARGVPDWIDGALAQAVHPDPLRRYDALSEFQADLQRPNARFRRERARPLAERDPVRFWQGVSALLALLVLLLVSRLA